MTTEHQHQHQTIDASLNILTMLLEKNQDWKEAHEARMAAHEADNESWKKTHEAHMAKLDALLAAHDERMEELHKNNVIWKEAHEARMEELRRDNAMTRRLWVKLAARYGWDDPEGLFDEP